jgi:hypothetical protein
MALHRDIYWVGKQWAVTGYGIQACDQKQKGKFDIESSRLWEDGVLDDMRELKWLNIQDFDKAISEARKHYPEPPQKAAPRKKKAAAPQESDTDLKEAGAKELSSKKAELKEPVAKQPGPKKSPVEEPKPAAQKFDMRIEGWPAKFVPQWRIRIKR